MGLLDKLFGKSIRQQKRTDAENEPEHSVILCFQYGLENLQALHDLEDTLEYVINRNAVGEYDGHEIATDYSAGFLYMYGPNAERLFKAVQPTLSETDFMRGATAKLRFGPPGDGAKEIEVEL